MEFKHFHDIDEVFEWIDSQLNKSDEQEKIKEVNGFLDYVYSLLYDEDLIK